MAKRAKPCSCTFCGKSYKKVKKLIAGPGVFICDECVGLCNDILGAEHPDSPGDPVDYFRGLPTRELARMMRSIEKVRIHVSDNQRRVVNVLRERDLTWDEIGRALRVSRQAAWRRFG